MTTNGDEFSEWLTAELRARRMSLRQLAERSGVNASTVSRIARGTRSPSLRTALRLMKVFQSADVGTDPSRHLYSVAGQVDPVTRIERALRADVRLSDADVTRLMTFYHGLRRLAPSVPAGEHRQAT
jgi:transcriptional regulator with XRE-family HTH domain